MLFARTLHVRLIFFFGAAPNAKFGDFSKHIIATENEQKRTRKATKVYLASVRVQATMAQKARANSPLMHRKVERNKNGLVLAAIKRKTCL